MSVKLTPSKRQFNGSPKEPNGKGKWQKTTSFGSQSSPFQRSSGSNLFRVLCPASIIDGDGDFISQICQETGAKVQVEEPVSGCDERIIVIAGSNKESEFGSEQTKEDNEESNPTGEGDNEDKNVEDDGEEKSLHAEDSQSDKGTKSIQMALLLVFERIVEGEQQINGDDEEGNKSTTVVMRLLVLSWQVGCLLGKGGSVIKQMSSESGAQIRILPRDKLPSIASLSDELVQISGGLDAVRKALETVSHQLLDNSTRDQETSSSQPSGTSLDHLGHPLSRPEAHSFPVQGPPHYVGSREGESGYLGRMNPSQDILTFRLLCLDEKVGGLIGKGGNIIKGLQHETGCEIKVLDGTADTEDRIISISGPAQPDDRISSAQDAVLRVQSRICRLQPESKEKTVTAKLLVSSNQIGCLLGKGGAIIAEMRKSTGAYIRILGKDQIPKCASENEEVVQINGEFEAVQEALLQITMRLRNHFFRDAFPFINHPSNRPFLDQGPPFPSYGGRRELSPSGMYSNLGPPFHKFDAVGVLPPHHGFHPHDDRPPFMHDFPRPGIAPHINERMPSSAPWGPQGLIEGGGPIGLPDYVGAPQRRISGFGGGNHPAIITNTTVEVVVPRSVVPAIYGEDGGCLKQIRQISDAKITITEPKPGTTETVIIISGTPEQTHAAQSLIQAFVISETEAP